MSKEKYQSKFNTLKEYFQAYVDGRIDPGAVSVVNIPAKTTVNIYLPPEPQVLDITCEFSL